MHTLRKFPKLLIQYVRTIRGKWHKTGGQMREAVVFGESEHNFGAKLMWFKIVQLSLNNNHNKNSSKYELKNVIHHFHLIF